MLRSVTESIGLSTVMLVISTKSEKKLLQLTLYVQSKRSYMKNLNLKEPANK